MTTRLTPEQEAAIEEFLKTRQHVRGPSAVVRVAYRAHVKALLAEMDALRRQLEDTEVALGLERADNAFKTALWETAIRDTVQLREELAAAKAGLVWSDELPTEEGWYWWLETKWSSPKALRIIEAWWQPRLFGHFDDNHDYERVNAMGGEWAGPIALPQGL